MSTFRDGRYRALFTVMYQCGLRLISVTVNTVTTAYSYDAQSRRTSKQVDSTPAIYYLYDGWNMIADYTIDDSSSPIQNSYSWGMDLSGSMQGAGGVGGLLAVTNHNLRLTSFPPTMEMATSVNILTQVESCKPTTSMTPLEIQRYLQVTKPLIFSTGLAPSR